MLFLSFVDHFSTIKKILMAHRNEDVLRKTWQNQPELYCGSLVDSYLQLSEYHWMSLCMLLHTE